MPNAFIHFTYAFNTKPISPLRWDTSLLLLLICSINKFCKYNVGNYIYQDFKIKEDYISKNIFFKYNLIKN